MKPQFKNIDIKSAGFAQTCPVEWASKQDNAQYGVPPSRSSLSPSTRRTTSKGWNTSTMLPVFLLTCAVLIAVCTLCVLGRSVSMQASLRLKSLMPSIAVTLPLVRRVFL